MSYKAHFRRFIEADPERIHFAAHSHHFWPDVSFDAHAEAWLDAARFADQKWERIFSEVIPRAQQHIAARLGLSDPSTIAFAPNTHELVNRLLSTFPRFPRARAIRVLTTDSEFHSFARQAARLEEDGVLDVTRVPVEPRASFVERFSALAGQAPWDLVFFSHVFFDSSYAVPDLARIIDAAPARAVVVVDGYHAFGALPVDFAAFQDRAFYLAGGYKYAMAGEGCCFLHAPAGYGQRPSDTGWFAAFGALESARSKGAVPYGPGGARFFGATFDPSGLYRLNAVMEWLDREGLTIATIHAHVHRLQELFVEGLGKLRLPLSPEQLVVPVSEPSRGHFLTFATPDAARFQAKLLAAKLVTDVRGDRLRFGFGLYHDADDVTRGLDRIRVALG